MSRPATWPGPPKWPPGWTAWWSVSSSTDSPITIAGSPATVMPASAPARVVELFQLNGLTYYYRGLAGNRYERLGAGLILGNSLLTARGIVAAGEGDLKTCLAMTMLDRMGAGGSYTEFYAMDFREQFVLMGHEDRKSVV